jgi:hypothetical protein
LERRNIPFTFCPAFPEIFGAQQKTKGESKAPDLYEPEPDGQKKPHSEEQDKCLGTPHDRGQKTNASFKNVHLFFVFPFSLDLFFDVFVEGKKVVTG